MPISSYEIYDSVEFGNFRLTFSIKKHSGEISIGLMFSKDIHLDHWSGGMLFQKMLAPLSDEDQQHIFDTISKEMGDEAAEVLLNKLIQELARLSLEGIYIEPDTFV